MKSLTLYGIPNNLEELLRAAGPTLESITIGSQFPGRQLAAEKLDIIKANCPNLSTIRLRVADGEDSALYKDPLCSYGQQLLVSNLDCLPVDVYVEILAACPNLRCGFDGGTDSHLFLARLSILRPRMKTIYFYFQDWQNASDHVMELGSLLRACSRLEHLVVVGRPIDLELLFEGDIPLPMKLAIDLSDMQRLGRDRTISDILLKLSTHAENRRDFKY